MTTSTPRVPAAQSLAERAELLFAEHRRRIFVRTDRLFVGLMLLQWFAAIGAAIVIAPIAWAGNQSYTHPHVWAAVLLGGSITLVPVALGLARPGRRSTRHVIAVGQMLMSGLLIHLTGGRIETHFHVFGSLAFIAFYRDPTLFIPATIVVAADHFLRGIYWPESVFGVTAVTWRWLEHAAWVIFEDIFLVYSCLESVKEMRDIAYKQAQLEAANWQTEATIRVRTSELRASEEVFRSLSAASPLGIFQTDAEGRLTYCNERWTDITGRPYEQSLGDEWSAVFQPEDTSRAIDERAPVVNDRSEIAYEFRVLTPNGLRWVQVRTNPMRSDIGAFVGLVGTVEDISERKAADAAREEEAYASASLARVGRELISSLETPVLIRRLCELSATVLEADYSTTWLHQADEDLYRPLSTYGLPEDQWGLLQTVCFRLDAFAEPFRGRLGRGEITVLRDEATVPSALSDILARHRAALVLCIPLLKGDALIGVQVAGYRDPEVGLTTGRERIARGIGQLASMALTNALLFEEVADASRLKSEFVSTMSHELRTPLNVIIGYTDLLADGPSVAEQRELLERVRGTSLELLEMISATLDLGRITSGKDAPCIERVEIRSLWAALSAEFATIPAKDGLTIYWNDPGGAALLTDRRKLVRIVKNLVGNALKFTATGEVAISCTVNAGMGTIVVRDTGIGIPKESLPVIFEMFRQVDSSDSRSYNGAGLGLYIVQRLVTQLGGSVDVESVVGAGSTFRVTLPLAGSSTDAIAPDAAVA